MSAESDIPTFRGGMDALWKDFDPMTLATPEAFAADPETVTKWYDWRRLKCSMAEPNPGHHALVRLESRLVQAGGSFTLLTQNVDGLHRRAGSRNVVELHGRIDTWRCSRTDEPEPIPEGPFETYPPTSAHGAPLRPDVVWFGEPLPEDALAAAERAAEACDLFVSIGTSALVYPAAGYVHLAGTRGAVTAEINADATGISDSVTHSIRGKSGEVLPRLLEFAFE